MFAINRTKEKALYESKYENKNVHPELRTGRVREICKCLLCIKFRVIEEVYRWQRLPLLGRGTRGPGIALRHRRPHREAALPPRVA